MNTTVANRVAELEAERWQPVPRRQSQRQRIREVAARPVSAEDQARHRAELLAALRNT